MFVLENDQSSTKDLGFTSWKKSFLILLRLTFLLIIFLSSEILGVENKNHLNVNSKSNT